jgi:transcriptional regulator with XRE-family HTH domain
MFSNVMDPSQIKALIKERGWTQREVALYFDVRHEWLNRIINNAGGVRGEKHDCMFRGLPQKNPGIVRWLEEKRKSNKAQK